VRLLFDNNLSPRLPHHLADVYPDASHVALVGLERAADDDVWRYAREHDFTIVTKDADFGDLSVLHGFPPGVIWLRIGNCSTAEIEDLLRKSHTTLQAFEAESATGLLTLLEPVRHSQRA
jgi:predicted nuclease of predicted toxin-antitoxin system